MALEKEDFSTISKYVQNTVQRLPPRAIKAVGISRVLGSPEADTPPATDASDRLATTAFVRSVVPAGAIMQYAGSTAPTGWFIADGSAVSRTGYADLFKAIGTTYGAGDGSTTFNLPDLRQRVPVGVGTGFALGASGGEQAHTLAAAEIPSHTHSGTTNTESTDHTHTFPVATAAGGSISFAAPGGVTLAGHTNTSGRSSVHTHTFTTDNGTGGGGSHNNLQPYLVLNHIIKA